MALNNAPVYTKEYRFGILPESTYGTSDEGKADICELTCTPMSIDYGVKIREIRGAHGSKDPIYNERVQNTSGSMAAFTIEQPINAYPGLAGVQSSFSLLANAHFQNQSAGVVSYFDTHPSGTGVAYSYTFFVKSPISSEDEIYVGCINRADNLTFERGEIVTQTVEVESKTTGLRGQTITGTLQQSGSAEQAPVATFEDFTYVIDINDTGDSNLVLKTLNLTHTWDEVEGLSPDGAGSLSDKGFVGRNGNTFDITFLQDDQARLAEIAWEKGQSVKVTVTAGASLAANWDFTDYFCTGKIESIEHPRGDDGLAYVTVNCKMLAADENSNMCEFDLT